MWSSLCRPFDKLTRQPAPVSRERLREHHHQQDGYSLLISCTRLRQGVQNTRKRLGLTVLESTFILVDKRIKRRKLGPAVLALGPLS